jgi:hypothetical protein
LEAGTGNHFVNGGGMNHRETGSFCCCHLDVVDLWIEEKLGKRMMDNLDDLVLTNFQQRTAAATNTQLCILVFVSTMI